MRGITRDRAVMGGQPVIAGTRVPTRVVDGMGRVHPDWPRRTYPHLTEAQIATALAYERLPWVRARRRLAAWRLVLVVWAWERWGA